MKPWILALVAAALLAGVFGGYVANRNEQASEAERERPVEAPSRVATANGRTVITVDPETQRSSGIEVVAAPVVQLRPEVRAYGVVLDSGRITELRNNYVAASAQLQTAHAKLAASKTAFERAHALYTDDRNVSLAQAQASEAAFRADEAGVSAAQSLRDSIAATAEQEWGAVLGRSLVEDGPLVSRLMKRREFLLQVTLAPGTILKGAPPRAELETARGGRVPIKFVSAAPRTDARIQGLSFFYTASAESGVLPGMNVLVYFAQAQAVPGVAVPEPAIVWWQNQAWAYRRTAEGTFTRVPIATNLPAPDGGYVVHDLPEGSTIVMRGAQLLLSEEFAAQLRVVGD